MKVKVKEIILKGVQLDIDPDDMYNMPVKVNADIVKNWLLLQMGGVVVDENSEQENQDDDKPPKIKGFNGED